MRSIGGSSHRVTDSLSPVNFLNKVYLYMSLGLLLTAVVAYYFHIHAAITEAIFRSPSSFFGVIILHLVVSLWCGRSLGRANPTTSFLLFFLYSALSGFTFGVVTLLYPAADVGFAFAVTAGSFFGLSLIGYTTKKDLSPVASFCIMGLWGLIIASLLSFFLPSLQTESMNLVYGALGVIVFAGLTAYNTQKIKNMAMSGDTQENHAINGAFSLYLDFVNLFFSILRLVGSRR